jgi:xanthine dehydrogenase molybdopterin-binding subunit B
VAENQQGKVDTNLRLLGMAGVAGNTTDLLAAARMREAAKESARYRISAAQAEVEQANQYAQQSLGVGGQQAAEMEGQAGLLAGQQALAQAANGQSLAGADATIQRLAAMNLGGLNANTIRSNAMRQALGIRAQAQGNLASAYMDASADVAQGQGGLLKSAFGLGKSILNFV